MVEHWYKQIIPLEYLVDLYYQGAQAPEDGYEGRISSRCVYNLLVEYRQKLVDRLISSTLVEFAIMLLEKGLEDLYEVFGKWKSSRGNEGLDGFRNILECPVGNNMISIMLYDGGFATWPIARIGRRLEGIEL